MAQNYKKDYIWNTLGVFVQNAISPLLLIIVTRVNGIDDSGVFSFAFSVAIIFWAIAMWGGRTYQVSDVANKFLRQSYVLTRIILSTAVLVAAYLFCVLNGYDQVKTAILMSLVFVKVTEALADVYYGVMQSNNKLYVSGKIMLVKYSIAMIAFVVTDFALHNLLLSCVAFASVMLLFLLAVDIPLTRQIDQGLKSQIFSAVTLKESRKITKILAPVFAVTLLAMLSLNIPRYFIDIYHQADIGYFGILAMPVTLIVLMMTLILQPNVVQLSHLLKMRKYDEFNKYVLKICTITAAVGLFILAGAAVIGVPALELVFGIDFSNYYYALIVIVFAAIINALVGVMINIFVIMRVFRPQVFVLIVTNLALVLASYLIIPTGGILSAMFLFMTVNIVQLLVLAVVYRGINHEK